MLKTVFLMIVLTDINGYESLHQSQHSYETLEQCEYDLDQYRHILEEAQTPFKSIYFCADQHLYTKTN